MELRPYQRECIQAIESHPPGAYLVQMATGLGKTVTFAHLPRHGGRMLLLSHREELVEQPRKYFRCSYGVERAQSRSHGEEVVSASVQTLVRRLDRFKPEEFDILITDECFPAGTMVDDTPIERIKPGDRVSSYNHATKKIEARVVRAVFKNPAPKEMISINGVLCTTNHPFFEIERGRYIEAKRLRPGDYILRGVRQGACLGDPSKEPEGYVQEVGEGVLRPRMLKEVLQPCLVSDNGQDQPEVRIRPDEGKEPHEGCGHEGEGIGNATAHGTQAEDPGRERAGADQSAGEPAQSAGRCGALGRVCGEDKPAETQSPASALALQDRHCGAELFSGRRDRREESLFPAKSRERPKKGGILEVVRVDSVEVFQCSDINRRKELCPDGHVYNIEVEGNHNYFANGYLVHNCHHAAAKTYKAIYSHFKPRLHIGFTATVSRGDRVRLDDVFSEIIFQRDLRWGIENGYLCDIYCKRVDIGYDLSAVHTRLGDYAPGELAVAMEGTADAIAQTWREHAAGPTLIFAVNVAQCHEIARRIPGAAVVTGETRDRGDIIKAFTAGEIPCIVNCMVFTEGTDIPRVETVIVARPTQSESLYAQMVGRGLRLYPGKERLTLIDCVGVTGRASLCTAPSLLGLDMAGIPAGRAKDVQGELFELPTRMVAAMDTPESWIRNVEIVDLWAREQSYNTHNVNFFKLPDGALTVSLPDGVKLTIPPPDALGNVKTKAGENIPLQAAIDLTYKLLTEKYREQAYLWDLDQVKRWGRAPATEKQLSIIQRRCRDFDPEGLTKGQASMILNRLFCGGDKRRKCG